eukprot:COSAG03_NODE_20007_length_326_cov_0.682819_1_plen_45_part_01
MATGGRGGSHTGPASSPARPLLLLMRLLLLLLLRLLLLLLLRLLL